MWYPKLWLILIVLRNEIQECEFRTSAVGIEEKSVNFQEKVYVIGNVEIDRIKDYLNAKMEKESAQARETKGYEYIKKFK